MKTRPQIMVIDDEVKMTKLLELILIDGLECDVETYNNPLLAYERLLVKSFDVISLDQRMPELLGTELVKILRIGNSPNSKTPIMIFTGFREEVELVVGDMDDLLFVEKPINDASYIRNIKLALQMQIKIKQAEL